MPSDMNCSLSRAPKEHGIMRSSAHVAIFLSCTLPLMLISPNALAGQSDEPHRSPFFVTTDTARESLIDSTVVSTGTVAAWREMPISAEANGLAISEIYVDEGDRVQKGQVLARLNPSILLAQLDQNRATVEEAEASLANARSNEKRGRSLSSGVLSQHNIEQRETLVKTSTAKLTAARAALEETKARLLQTEIVAPANAIVASRSASLGQVVQAGIELFRLIQDERIEVNALVSEADLFKVMPHQSARIIDPTGHVTHATVRLVTPLVDGTTRLGTVRIALPAQTRLKPGMFVRVEIDAGRTAALTVPLRALVWREGKAAVFTLGDAGTTILKTVTPGRKTSSSVEIVMGLERGERVVVEGAGLLNDGEKVRAEVATSQPPMKMP